jgi:hypothetical protein
LTWETVSELDNLGFHLYRAETLDGPQTRLNTHLIPSPAPGSPVGAAYAWWDGNVTPGVIYYYWLESVAIHGPVSRHGPVMTQVSPGGRDRIYLPLVSQ